MRKRLIALIAAVVLLLSSLTASGSAEQSSDKIYGEGDTGDAIVCIQIRLRDLGYLCYRPTGAYRSMTADAVKAFQRRSGDYGKSLAVDGRTGPETLKYLFEYGAPRVRIPDSVHIPKGPDSSRLQATGRRLNWSGVKPLLTVGATYTVTDCYTGTMLTMVYGGGENHAEMEISDNEQLEAFLGICGDEYNFLKRPIVVEINGENIAASIQCWPHGTDISTKNDMNGHCCVFFDGSLSHVGALSDVEHNLNINKASGG